MAEKLFNQGDHSDAIKHALKAKTLLGKSNSRIEYLLTSAYNAQGDYGNAMASLEEFFNVTPESSSGTEEYNEMVSLYSELEILLQKQIEKQEAIKEKKKKDETTKEVVSLMLSQQMVAVPSGCFKMGNSSIFSGDDDEKPSHKVCLDSFHIGKYEVTQALWTTVMGSNPSDTPGDDYPVTGVSMMDVQQFLHELNRLTDKHYRLPTEAEWEYAARSGGKKEKYSGGKDLKKVSWYVKNSNGSTHPVGQKNANGLGLYDMTGNVWEWCQDWYGKSYYNGGDVNNPVGPIKGKYRIKRGGSYLSKSNTSRINYRSNLLPKKGKNNTGFRLVHH